MKLRGQQIVISISGTPIALCRDCSVEVERKMVEKASASTGDAREFVPGRYAWKMQSAHLVGNFTQNTLMNYLLSKTALSIKFGTSEEGEAFSFSGTAYLSNFKMAAPLHGFATANCDFQGSGTLSILPAPTPPPR